MPYTSFVGNNRNKRQNCFMSNSKEVKKSTDSKEKDGQPKQKKPTGRGVRARKTHSVSLRTKRLRKQFMLESSLD
jgi:hypothetical protein